jgi:hypothetical protein
LRLRSLNCQLFCEDGWWEWRSGRPSRASVEQWGIVLSVDLWQEAGYSLSVT